MKAVLMDEFGGVEVLSVAAARRDPPVAVFDVLLGAGVVGAGLDGHGPAGGPSQTHAVDAAEPVVRADDHRYDECN